MSSKEKTQVGQKAKDGEQENRMSHFKRGLRMSREREEPESNCETMPQERV